MKRLPKYILLLLLSFTLCFNLTSCTDDEVKTYSVTEALESKSGTKVTVEGICYYQDSNGYYITNNNNNIFVAKGTENTTINVGDKLKVEGFYSLFLSEPKIVRTKSVTVVSNNNEISNNIEMKLFDLVDSLSNDKTVYYKNITLKGTLIKENSKYYLKDFFNNKVLLDKGNDNLLNKVVSFSAIITGYNEGWMIAVTSEFTESSFTLSEMSDYAIKDLEGRVTENIYNKFTAPTSNITGVTYSFTCTTYKNLSSFTQTTTNKTDTIKLKITYNGNTSNVIKEYPVKLWNKDYKDVKDFLDSTPEGNETCVYVKGVVSQVLYNSSLTYKSIIIKDFNTNDTIMASKYIGSSDPDEATLTFIEASVGNEVKVRGRYNYSSTSSTTGAVTSYKNCIYLTTGTSATSGLIEITSEDSENHKVNYESAFILNSLNSYSEAVSNYEDYFGRLLCLKNQFYCYSGSAGTESNWIIPLYSADRTTIYSSLIITNSDGIQKRKRIALSVKGNDYVYGDSSWRTGFDIPNNNYDYERIGCDIYGYFVPVSNTSEYIQFVICGYDGLILDEETKINNSIIAQTQTNYIDACNDLTLISNINGVNITWASSDSSLIDIGSECVILPEYSKKVTLTASYTLNNENKTLDIPVYLSGTSLENVSTILEHENNQAVYSKGVIVAYGSETLSSSYRTLEEVEKGEDLTFRGNKGFVVKDLNTNDLIFVNYVEFYLSQNYPNFEHQYTEYKTYHTTEQESWGFFKIGDNELKIGSVIEFKGIYNKDEKSVSIKDGYLGFVETLANYSIDKANVIEVNNQDELSNAIYKINSDGSTSTNFMTVIKLVGTTTNKIYFTPTSSKEGSTNNMNFRIHYNSKSTSSDTTAFDGISLVLKQDNQYANTLKNGEYPSTTDHNTLWYTKLGLPEIGVPNKLYPGYGFVGTMYITIVYDSSSSDGLNCFYHSATILEFDSWNLALEAFPKGLETSNE